MCPTLSLTPTLTLTLALDLAQDICFICEAGGVGVLASARPSTSHLGSQLVAKQDVYLTMVGREHV